MLFHTAPVTKDFIIVRIPSEQLPAVLILALFMMHAWVAKNQHKREKTSNNILKS